MVDVVAALIWDHDRFMICQRPAQKARGLLWEFVGGKLEPNETPEQALIRECQEELAVIVQPCGLFMELVHEYPDITVRLMLHHARIVHGTPKLLEHNDIQWIHISEIDLYDFCPADTEILQRLKQIETPLQLKLLQNSDLAYRRFQHKLMPTVPYGKILGVRMPDLRKIYRQEKNLYEQGGFLNSLPHKFHEEDNLHGIIISNMTNFTKIVDALDVFLPYVDNWATCDLIVPKIFAIHKEALLPYILRWLQSSHTYTVRFAIGMLMHFYLDDANCQQAMKYVAGVQSEAYYVKMMIAWFFASALDKQYDAAIRYLTEKSLQIWTHNKTIQKAIDSKRIAEVKKNYLNSLKIK